MSGDAQRFSERIGWIDAARAISIVFVVFGHLLLYLDQATGHDVSALTVVNDTLAPLRLPVFFIASGLVARKWYIASWGDLLARKVWLFLWVGTVWSVLTVLATSTFRLDGSARPPLWQTAVRIVIAPIYPAGASWFLLTLALLFIAARMFNSVLTSRQHLAFALGLTVVSTGAMALVGLGYSEELFHQLAYLGFFRYYFFFVAGALMQDTILPLAAQIGAHHWKTAGVAVLGLTFLYGLVTLELSELPVLNVAVRAFAVVVGIAWAHLIVKVPSVTALGQRTLQIFVTHSAVILITAFAVQHLAPAILTWAASIPCALALWAWAVVAPLLLHRLCARSPLRYLYEAPRTPLLKLARTPEAAQM